MAAQKRQVYDNGVTSVESKRFQHIFEEVFPPSSFNMRFFLLAGNHDWLGLYPFRPWTDRSGAYYTRVDPGSFRSPFAQTKRASNASHLLWLQTGTITGNITAEVLYSQRNPRWVFPDLYYTWTDVVSVVHRSRRGSDEGAGSRRGRVQRGKAGECVCVCLDVEHSNRWTLCSIASPLCEE